MTARRPAPPAASGGGITAWASRLLCWLRPPRVLRPTREGWWFIAAAFTLGLAATNTGNNLLYLLFAMLLGFITISGFLSEQVHRGLSVHRVQPRVVHAGAPAYFGLAVENRKGRVPSFSLHLEEVDPASGALRRHYILRLGPGESTTRVYPLVFPRRGLHRLSGYRVWTRFPFGLFTKATRLREAEEVLVLPAVYPLLGAAAGSPWGAGQRPQPRRGQGAELHALRDFRPGDDPRLVHWKSTARLGRLILRELEDEETSRLRLVLVDPSPGAAEDAVERDISLAASLAAHWVGRGHEVQLVLPDRETPWGSDPRHLRQILESLARFRPLPGRPPRQRDRVSAAATDVWITPGLGAARGPVPTPPGPAGPVPRRTPTTGPDP
jgi:uncharacterized protein (DUF58 family)